MEPLGWIIALLLVAYIWLAPVGECDHCVHCRYKRIQENIKDKETRERYAHDWLLVNPDECRCQRCLERIRKRDEKL